MLCFARVLADDVGRALAEAGLVVDLIEASLMNVSAILRNMSSDGIRYACVVEEQRGGRLEVSVAYLSIPNYEAAMLRGLPRDAAVASVARDFNSAPVPSVPPRAPINAGIGAAGGALNGLLGTIPNTAGAGLPGYGRPSGPLAGAPHPLQPSPLPSAPQPSYLDHQAGSDRVGLLAIPLVIIIVIIIIHLRAIYIYIYIHTYTHTHIYIYINHLRLFALTNWLIYTPSIAFLAKCLLQGPYAESRASSRPAWPSASEPPLPYGRRSPPPIQQPSYSDSRCVLLFQYVFNHPIHMYNM